MLSTRRKQKGNKAGKDAKSPSAENELYVFKGQKSLRKLVWKIGKIKVSDADIFTLYSRIQPSDSLRKDIVEFAARQNMKTRVGLHIRRTDHVKAAVSKGRFSTDEFFINAIEEALRTNSGATFFLATDNAETQIKFMSRYKGKIVVYKEIKTQNISPTTNTRHTTLRDAVIDAFSLTLL